MRNFNLLAGGIAAWVICMPFAANAQATQEGADKIRLGLKEWIASHLSPADKSVVFNFQGPITVEPQGKSYKAVIPKSEIAFSGDDQVKLPLDAIELVLTPTDNGWLDTVATIPSHYRPEDKNGKGIDVTIGSQSLHGVFAPQYQTFMALDSSLGGIVAHSLDPKEAKGAFKLGGIAIKGDSQETGKDTYDSTGTVTLTDGSFVDETGAQVVQLDSATLEGKVTAAKLLALYAFSKKLEALQKSYPDTSDPEQSKKLTAELGKTFATTPNLFDDFGFTYGLKGLTVTPPAGEGDGVNKVSIDQVDFGIGLTGLAKDASTFRITFDLAKLGIDPLPEFGQFIPHTATVDLALTGLPNDALLQALSSMLDASGTLGPDQAGQIAGAQLMQALLSSNGAIEIRSVKAESPLTSIDLTGLVKPNQKAPLMATGDVKLVVTGLEDALEAVKAAPDGQEIVQGLTVLQTMGAQDTVDGKPARIYKLSVSEKGDVLLNGTDLKPLLGMH
jgi:hypothetical protein